MRLPTKPARSGLAFAAKVLSIVPIATTLMPLWRTSRGWVRIWDFPRTQIAALGLLASAALPPRGNSLLRTALALCTGYQCLKILPYTPFYRRQVHSAGDAPRGRRIRLFEANVFQDNRRADLVLDAIQRAHPDIVCLVETNSWWDRQTACLERDFRWSHKCILDNTYGMVLYSRLPLSCAETMFLVEPSIPSIRARVKLPSGDEVDLYAVHPRPPLPGTPSHGRDAELVLIGTAIGRTGRPSVVIGDLNDVAWSYTTTLFQRISHTLDPRVGRGMYSTFHAGHSLARYPLDHIFHTRDFTLAELHVFPYVGSDHFPILAELAYTPSRKHEMEKPVTSEEDRENAQEILDEALPSKEGEGD